jgi:hypothetical protein
MLLPALLRTASANQVTSPNDKHMTAARLLARWLLLSLMLAAATTAIAAEGEAMHAVICIILNVKLHFKVCIGTNTASMACHMIANLKV